MMESNYNEIKLTQRCPHCNGELMQLSYLDPMSFDFQTKTKIVCTHCHRELQRSDLKVTESIEEKNEGTELPNGAMMGWICPKCGAVMSPYQNYCINCSRQNWEITYNTNATNTNDNSNFSQYLGFSRKDTLGYE